MANTNCLEGMQCPKCGQEEKLLIEMRAVTELFDSGTGDAADTHWDDKSYCECPECGESGKVKKFRIKAKKG